jgi:hypothetical protein
LLPVGFTGIHKNWKKAHKGRKRGASLVAGAQRERGKEREGDTHQRGKGRSTWTPPVKRSPERGGRRRGSDRQRPREGQRTEQRDCLASGARGERIFKNRVWAHRTVYSACPVHTGQRTGERGTGARAAGAPDSAQCSVRCTPDCLVSPDRGKI